MLLPNSLVTKVFQERTNDGTHAFVGADAHIGPCRRSSAEMCRIICT